jgi:hypothetical protein
MIVIQNKIRATAQEQTPHILNLPTRCRVQFQICAHGQRPHCGCKGPCRSTRTADLTVSMPNGRRTNARDDDGGPSLQTCVLACRGRNALGPGAADIPTTRLRTRGRTTCVLCGPDMDSMLSSYSRNSPAYRQIRVDERHRTAAPTWMQAATNCCRLAFAFQPASFHSFRDAKCSHASIARQQPVHPWTVFLTKQHASPFATA